MEKCIVCKQDLDTSVAIKTDKGFVHFGECHEHVKNLPVVENDDNDEILNETELLL